MITNSTSLEYLNKFTSIILDSAITVHKEMVPGLLESVYQQCMATELRDMKLDVHVQFPVPLIYKGKNLNKDYVIDLLVEREILIELKAVEGILPVHEAQVISYLKLANKKVGLLINFNVPLLKQGFKRFVN